jgi:hypothetical protein
MSVETTNLSKQRVLKSLKYLVLTAAILIGATGVSSAEPVTHSFTVTADIGCDTSDMTLDNPGTIDTMVVAAGSTLIFGEVVPNQTESIIFDLTASNRTACDETTDRGVDNISIEYSDMMSMSDSCGVVVGDLLVVCDTESTSITVNVIFPNLEGPYSETITFSIGP